MLEILVTAGFVAASLNKPIYTGRKNEFVPTHHLMHKMDPLPVTRKQGREAFGAILSVPSEESLFVPLLLLPEHSTLTDLKQWQKLEGALGEAAKEALTFVDSLPEGMPMPWALISPTREVVTLVWQEDLVYSEVEFSGEGSCYVYRRMVEADHGEGLHGVRVAATMAPEARALLEPLMDVYLLPADDANYALTA